MQNDSLSSMWYVVFTSWSFCAAVLLSSLPQFNLLKEGILRVGEKKGGYPVSVAKLNLCGLGESLLWMKILTVNFHHQKNAQGKVSAYKFLRLEISRKKNFQRCPVGCLLSLRCINSNCISVQPELSAPCQHSQITKCGIFFFQSIPSSVYVRQEADGRHKISAMETFISYPWNLILIIVFYFIEPILSIYFVAGHKMILKVWLFGLLAL